MATLTWPWRRTMRVRVLWTEFTASPRIERRGTMYRKYRTPTSGRARDVLLTLTSILTRSTKTFPPTAVSYSPTNRRERVVGRVSFSGNPEFGLRKLELILK